MAAPKLETVPKRTDEDIARDLKAQHQVEAVHVFTAETGEKAFFRAPSNPVWRRFRSHMSDTRKRDEAGENLVRSCLLYPDKATFDGWLESRPALIETFTDELAQVAGLSKDVEKKVL